MYEVTVLGGGGKGFRDDSTKALLTKRVTMWFKNCPKLTSFMDDPKAKKVLKIWVLLQSDTGWQVTQSISLLFFCRADDFKKKHEELLKKHEELLKK